jgi:hypothetical protein
MAYSFHKQFVLLKAIEAADFVTAKYRADVKAMPTSPPPRPPLLQPLGEPAEHCPVTLN